MSHTWTYAERWDLLLLPALPAPLERSVLWSLYKETFETLLPQLVPPSRESISRLDLAITIPATAAGQGESRTKLYPEVQHILQEVYTLICSAAAHKKVELDFPGGVDVRIFFVTAHAQQLASAPGQQTLSGPMISLRSLAAAQRPYKTLWTIAGAAGDAVSQAFLATWHEKDVSPPFVTQQLKSKSATSPKHQVEGSYTGNENQKVHRSVAVGGTFDHLHIGHKLLLAITVFVPQPEADDQSSRSRKITIGITGDELLVNKKHPGLVESWEERQTRTADFVDSMLVFHPDVDSIRTVVQLDEPGPNGKIVRVSYGGCVTINYTRISDPFGPTITDEDISAIIISAETRAGGKAVNDKRAEKGWAELEVFEVEVLDANIDGGTKPSQAENSNFESKISSTDIRRRLAEITPTANG